jgi:hypothetical protein
MMTRASNRMALKGKMLMRSGSTRRNNMVLWMAAAALSTQTTTMIPTAQAAFVGTVPVGQSRRLTTTTTTRDPGFASSNSPQLHSRPQYPAWNLQQTTRLYSSKKDSSGSGSGSGSGIISKVKNVVKSILPTSWFQSEKEKKAAIQRKIVKDEVKGSLAAMLKDAPLPVRMIGSMIAPLMSTVMAGLAESMAEQQATIESVLKDARSYLAADAGVASIIGSGIQLGQPQSQSASSTNINGQKTSRIELGLPVTGSLGTGTVRLSAANGKIEKLQVEVNGKVIAVNLSSNGGQWRRKSAFSGSRSSSGDDIIEAEIIEKKTKV